TCALDVRQALGDAVDVGLAADQPDIRMLLGLPDQMLAGTEADLEPDFPRAVKNGRQIELLRLRRQFQRNLRQQRIEQGLLPGAKLLAAPAAVKRAVFLLRHLTGHMTTSIRYGPFCDMA